MDYDYPAVLDDEEEKKEHPYPAAAPPTPDPENRAFPPVAPPVGAEPSAPSLAVAAANTPAPKYSDYAPAAPHGWSKAGHVLAAINPTSNRIVNEVPAEKAKLRYENATKERDTQFAQGSELEKEAQVRAKEKSEEGLRSAEGHQHEATAKATEQGTDLLPWYNPDTKRTEQVTRKQWGDLTKSTAQDDTKRDIANIKKSNERSQIKVMGDGTYEELEKGKWTRIGDAPPRTEPGNYVPVPSDDGTGATVGWINPKTKHFVGVSEIGGAQGVAPGGAIPPKPSGQTMSRQDQARAIDRASDGMIETLENNKNKVGNVEAIIKSAFLGTPLADPTLSGIATELGSYAALQPALHGFRGQDALNEFMKIIGGVPKDADALIASIKAIKKTAGYVNPAIEKNKNAAGGGAKPQAPPKVGDVVKGHVFLGGDPAKKESWKKQ